MKKSKIFMIAATAVLAVVAVFASKANKKFFASVSTAYFDGGTAGWYIAGTSNLLTTLNTNSSPQLRVTVFYTNAGTLEEKVRGNTVDKANNNPAVYK
jgi:hypothetical protein